MRTKTAKNTGLGLILLFAVVYLLPLNLRQLGIPDEMRYGEIAREMLASGDFVSPHLAGLRYFEKPAGGHALNALAMAVFGETNFGVRFMSALAAGLSAFGLYLLAKRETDARIAALGALVFLTCAEVMAIGTNSVLDSMVTCFITLTLCCFYPALGTTGMKRTGWLVLTGLFAGGAFLVKGFIAFAVPVVVIVPFLLVQKRWKDLFILPWIPLIAAIAICLPWSLAVAAREPDFWRYFFWEEHIHRFFSQGHAQHENPFWYFIPVFIAGTIPWIFIAPLPLRNLLRRRLREPMVRFALCWVLAPFLFFSASSGKLATYILPCFPPFALLLAMALADRFEEREENRWLKVGISIFLGIVGILLLALPIVVALNALHKLPELDAHTGLKFCGLFAGLSLTVTLLIVALRSPNLYRKAALLGVSAALFFVTLIVNLPTEISPALGIQSFLESEQRNVTPDSILVGEPITAHAICYVYKRDDIYLYSKMGEFDYGLTYPEAKHRFLADADALNTLIMTRGDKRVVVVIKVKRSDPIKSLLPEPTYQNQWLKIWFAVYEPQSKQ